MTSGAANEYDVVIVGAGPAGATLARLIDSERYRVLLVDGSDDREKVCGGLISPDAQDFLAAHDISLPKDVLVTPQLFSVRTVDLADGLTRYYRRSYMNVDRRRFDAFLLGMVPDSVETVQGRCQHLRREGKGFCFELTGRGEVRCKYIVGADGASSAVRKSLFPERKITKYTAIQQWFDASGEEPYYSCIFDNATSEGCSWIFFKDGRLVFGGAFGMRGSREAFEAQKRKLVSLGIVPQSLFDRPVRTEACQVSRPRLSGGICMGEERAFLVGEAAGLISPSSFEGISYAMTSAEALAEAFSKGNTARSIRKSYQKGTRKLKMKISLRCLKRPFMYDRFLRRAVMKSGIASIRIKKKEH